MGFPPVGQRFLLATALPSRAHRRLALSVSIGLLGLFAFSGPFLSVQLSPSPAFIAAFQTAFFLTDLITTTLLFAQFTILRWRSLLALASGYLFTSLMAISYAFAFPGVFAPTGLFGANYQAAGWVFLFWHCGLPLAVIAYVLLIRTDVGSKRGYASVRGAIILSSGTVIAVVCFLTWESIGAGKLLPPLFADAVHITRFAQALAVAWLVLSAAAVALLAARPQKSVLDLWLIVVLWAWMLEGIFFVLLVPIRYSLAFYVSRFFSLVTASVILLLLLSETTRLYTRLARSLMLERREREERLMTIEAMSASIVHEMRQPLGAMVASSDAALLWIERLHLT